jgi:hypothetical protein
MKRPATFGIELPVGRLELAGVMMDSTGLASAELVEARPLKLATCTPPTQGSLLQASSTLLQYCCMLEGQQFSTVANLQYISTVLMQASNTQGQHSCKPSVH